MKAVRRRFISKGRLSREQALWLCRAILTHYRVDGKTGDNEKDYFNITNRVNKTAGYKRGRDWVLHPVGYDLQEIWYGTTESGIREAWAALVALPISRAVAAPQEYRTFNTFGLVNENRISIAVYHITEVTATSRDQNFVNYVKDCFGRVADDVEEIPEYVTKGRQGREKEFQNASLIRESPKRGAPSK